MCDARVTLVTSDVLDSIRAAYLAGKLVDALELCAARCESDARDSPEFLILHGCLLVLSNQREAGEAKIRAGKDAPWTTAAWGTDLGLGLFLIGELQESRKVLEEVLSRPDASAVAYGRLGATFLSLDDPAGAKAAYQDAVKREPGRPEWHYNLALGLVREQLLEEALEHLDTALRINPDLGPAIKSRQQVLVALERTEEAIAALEAKVRQDPKDMSFRLHLARLLDLDNRPLEATDQLREASKIDADNVAPYLEVAQLFVRRGQQARALRALRLAESKDKENLAVLNGIARALNELKRHDAALETVERAISLHPDAVALLVTRATIYSEKGDYERAERELRTLVEIYPGDAPLLSTLGHTLMWIGRIEEAVECFEKAAAINPMALAHMVQARALPDDPEVIERMERFTENPLLADEVRSAMSFAVAETWQKRKDYDRAFTHADRANELAHKTMMYDADSISRMVDKTIETYTADFFERLAGNGNPSERPVFVCGMPRSGTTLVEQILSSHPEVFGAGELSFVPSITKRMKGILGAEEPYPLCMADVDGRTIQMAATYYLRNVRALDDQARFVVDKMPHNFVYLGLIALMLPNAKVVHLQRDPRDVAVSNYFQNFKAKHGMMGFAFNLKDIGQHLNDHERLMAHWHEVLPLPIYECNYEELVQDQVRRTGELLDFVGVDWSDDVMAFHKTERAVKTASVWQVRQPIYQSSTQKWRRYERYLEPLNEVLIEPQPPALRARSGG